MYRHMDQQPGRVGPARTGVHNQIRSCENEYNAIYVNCEMCVILCKLTCLIDDWIYLLEAELAIWGAWSRHPGGCPGGDGGSWKLEGM